MSLNLVFPLPLRERAKGEGGRSDLILCQITSKTINDKYAIVVNDNDFETGGLKQPSNIRPNRIFTADTHIILYRIGNLKNVKVSEVIESIVEIIRK